MLLERQQYRMFIPRWLWTGRAKAGRTLATTRTSRLSDESRSAVIARTAVCKKKVSERNKSRTDV